MSEEVNYRNAIRQVDRVTTTSSAEDQVEELKKWKVLQNIPEYFLGQVRYAVAARRFDLVEQESPYDHAFMITYNDKAYVIGDNFWGELGVDRSIKYVDDAAENKQLSGLGIIGFSVGGGHVSAWTKDGKLYMMGRDSEGQLGQGHENEVEGPQQVLQEMNVKVLKAACGAFHTLCVTTDGNVFAWGDFSEQQCSAVSVSPFFEPTQIKFPTESIKIVDVACTTWSSFALTADGHLYGWGDNLYGQVGTGSNDEKVETPRKISIPNDERVKKVSCGYAHCMALTTKGTLFVWGCNDDGELGTGSTESSNTPVKIDISNVVSISATNVSESSVCKTSDGKIYAWGRFVDSTTPKLTEFTSINDCRAHYQLGMSETWVSKFNIEPDCRTFLSNYVNLKKITFQVEGKQITASKVHVQRCHFFQEKLKKEWKEELKTSGVIKIAEFKVQHFQIFVNYLHTDDVKADTGDDLIDLLELAYFYKMERFRLAIVDLVRKALTVDNTVQFYCVALKHNDKILQLAVINFIKPRPLEIMDKMDLTAVDQATVVKLIADIKASGAFKSKR